MSTSDYRESHLGKGADYDRDLSGDGFNGYMAVREKEILAQILSRWAANGVARYLDFACGTGRITQTLAPVAEESFGVDVSENMLDQARKKCPKTTFFLQDITRDPLPEKGFDMVSAFRFFANAQNDLRVDALKAIRDHMKDGGLFILNNHINTSTMHSVILRTLTSEKPVGLNHSECHRLLATHGFVVREQYGVGFWMIRSKLMQPDVLNSRWAQILEKFSGISALAPYSPDCVIVAQKISS